MKAEICEGEYFLPWDFDPRVAVIAAHDLVGNELLVLLDHRVFVAPTDQAFDGEERVLRIGDGLSLGRKSYDDLAVIGEGDHRGGGAHAFRILDDLRALALHHRNTGIGGAEIDSDHFRHLGPLFLADRAGPEAAPGNLAQRVSVGPQDFGDPPTHPAGFRGYIGGNPMARKEKREIAAACARARYARRFQAPIRMGVRQ